jgi:hypothetical protein
MVRHKGGEGELVAAVARRVNFVTKRLGSDIQFQQLCTVSNFLHSSEKRPSRLLNMFKGIPVFFLPTTALPCPLGHIVASHV